MKKFLFFTAIMLFMFSMVVTARGAEVKSWYFKDSEFDSLNHGLLRETKTINGLTLRYGIDIVENRTPVKAFFFEKTIYTAENGSTVRGCVSFHVEKNTDIHILGRTKSASEARILNVYSATDNVTREIVMTTEVEDHVIRYTGESGEVYLYSPQKGVKLYGITLKPYGADGNKYEPLGEGNKKVWDFENYKDSVGAITQNTNFDGLEIKASEKWPVNLESKSGSKGLYGYVKHWYVNLEGMPKEENRQISFPVNKNSDVYITARSSDGKSERKLMLYNEFYGTPDTSIHSDIINVGANAETYKLSYYGEGETFTLCSYDSGIKVYRISVVPRINKKAPDKNWDIANNNSFALGSYDNATIDGLTMIKASIENNEDTGNQKAIHIKSYLYFEGKCGKLKFNISDSSKNRGTYGKRIITIKAKSAYSQAGMKLVLMNSDEEVIGSADLSNEIQEYKFEYTGSYDTIYLYSYYKDNCSTKGAYIYSIDNGVSATTGIDDAVRTVSVTKGQKYRYYFTADNIDPDAYTYTIKYNNYALTAKYIGFGDGTDNYSTEGIRIIKNQDGEIVYTIDNKNSNWNGATISVIFQAESTGNTTLEYIADSNL